MDITGNCAICHSELRTVSSGAAAPDMPSEADPTVCDFCYSELMSGDESKYRDHPDNLNNEQLAKHFDQRVQGILLSTTDHIHGHKILTHLGIARGGTVRAKNAISDVGAGIKNIVGGELKAYTKLLAHAREEAIYRMKLDATNIGADAIIGVNFSTSMIDIGAAEISAFGTAVTLAKEGNSD